uniref:hypothetical protein n=1 Tax=Serratia entomophila TaxID=42906 RepID=UPI001F4C2888|nr:hypothetical protein [Serratia entomophila]ULG11317.1 hypothetical protein 345p3_00028 [Serratia entomophila]
MIEGGTMKYFTITALFVAVIALSGCDDKQEKIDFYMKSENATDYAKGLAKCKAGTSEAKDCDAIYEVEKMKRKITQTIRSRSLRKNSASIINPATYITQPALAGFLYLI